MSFAESQLSLDAAIDRVSIIDWGCMPGRVSNFIRKCAPLCQSVPRCTMSMAWHAASSPLQGTVLSAAAARVIATAARTPITAAGGRFNRFMATLRRMILQDTIRVGRAQLAIVVAPRLGSTRRSVLPVSRRLPAAANV